MSQNPKKTEELSVQKRSIFNDEPQYPGKSVRRKKMRGAKSKSAVQQRGEGEKEVDTDNFETEQTRQTAVGDSKEQDRLTNPGLEGSEGVGRDGHRRGSVFKMENLRSAMRGVRNIPVKTTEKVTQGTKKKIFILNLKLIFCD